MIKTRLKLFYTIIIVLTCITKFTYAQSNIVPDIKKLDKLFILASDKIHKKLLSKIKSKSISDNDISLLYKKIKTLNENGQYFLAITEIYKNELVIKNNIDNESIYYFIKILLKHNRWIISSRLLNHINKEGDKSLSSNVKYIFAKYHFKRREWIKTLNILSGIYSDLGINEGHYALILSGIALQKLKKHRKALKYYDQVPITSRFYNYAQLNKATVYIKQGWWTDAHIIINKLLAIDIKNVTHQSEFINRLYLVLGYSYLQQEYFRESRNAFRNIQKSSQYTTRALLGISLAAANQGDNIGALNILNILQEDKANSLATEESYLLLPYIYERLGQYKTASASYSIALTYYQNRIFEVNNIIESTKKMSPGILLEKNNVSDTSVYNIYITKDKSTTLSNLNELLNLQSNISNKKLKKEIDKIIEQYINLISNQTIGEQEKTLGNLKSYLNQSQYGIARLYDNSRTINKNE